MGKQRIGLLGIIVVYVVYTWLLFKPPRAGWDLLVVKITIWLLATLLSIIIIAGYWALFKEK
ncbi:MAG: hypothetical protein F7B59_02315 [Desulfurococcales archaeon]|nr:hypothetical protein [Desulfurococcales archaeon]